MKYAFAGAALIAGALAVPAWGPETETVEVTTLATITSCGPEVTNCPAKSSAAWTKPTGGWGDSWSETWSTASSSAPTTSSASSTWTTLSPPTTVPVTTSTTWAPIVPPVSSSSSAWAVPPVSSSTWAPIVPPVTTSTTPAGPTYPVGTAPPAHGSSSCGPGHPGWPGYSGVAPSGTAPGGVKPTGSGTGVWSYPSPSGSPITPSTGGAAQNAAGLLAGIGAIAAFFL